MRRSRARPLAEGVRGARYLFLPPSNGNVPGVPGAFMDGSCCGMCGLHGLQGWACGGDAAGGIGLEGMLGMEWTSDPSQQHPACHPRYQAHGARCARFMARSRLALVCGPVARVFDMLYNIHMLNDASAARFVDQGISPLCEAGAPPNIAPDDIYSSAHEIRRAALVDPGAPLPVRERLFAETTRKIHSVKGRLLKKTRVHVLPGAAAGTVAFADFHPYGKDALYIDYIVVRPDMRGHGLGLQLAREFYRDASQKGITLIHWGKVMNENVWKIMETMRAEFPEIQTLGKVWF